RLSLQPTRRALILPSLILWAIGSLGVPLTWLLVSNSTPLRIIAPSSQLAGAVLYAVALRLYEGRARRSTIPLATDPPRIWLRVAFGFLLVGAAINVLAAGGGELGSSTALVQLSGARHALALGFLLPVIVFMAARVLPVYSASMLAHPRRLELLLWCLFAGAFLRAGGELIGGYGAGWNLAVAAGGTLTVVGFLAFAIPLWQRTSARQPP